VHTISFRAYTPYTTNAHICTHTADWEEIDNTIYLGHYPKKDTMQNSTFTWGITAEGRWLGILDTEVVKRLDKPTAGR